MPQRYYGAKDLATIEKFNRELLGEPNISDDGIIDQFVILYRDYQYMKPIPICMEKHQRVKFIKHQ